MADPVSIIGLISATVHLTETISSQIPHFKDAPKEAEDLRKEVIAVGLVLEKLKSLLQQNAVTGNTSFTFTSALFSSVEGCQNKLKDICDSLELFPSERKIIRIWGRLKWVADRNNVLEAVASLHRYTQIFHFALSIDGMYVASNI
jgi:hypothetical protein